MINSLLSGIISFLTSLGNVYLAPINSVITNYFPDINNMIGLINQVLTYITDIIGWFIYLIPPNCRAVIILIIQFWVLVWPLRMAIWNITWGLDLVKRINLFSGK